MSRPSFVEKIKIVWKLWRMKPYRFTVNSLEADPSVAAFLDGYLTKHGFTKIVPMQQNHVVHYIHPKRFEKFKSMYTCDDMLYADNEVIVSYERKRF